MLIAVASKSGKEVDTHFGHAERFLIYDCGGGDIRKIREVSVEKYCSFDPDHPMRGNKLEKILAGIDGCRAVVTAMIGELPKQELEKEGITAISAVGPIEQALRTAHDTLCGCACRCAPGAC